MKTINILTAAFILTIFSGYAQNAKLKKAAEDFLGGLFCV